MALRFTKEEIVLHYKDDKPTAYKLKLVKEQPLKYKQLCRNIAVSTGIRKGEVEDVIDGLIIQMVQMMDMGHPVQLGDFGTFKPSVITKCEYEKNDLSIKNVLRRKILFYPGEAFKEMLKDINLSTTNISGEDKEDEEVVDNNVNTEGGSGDGSQVEDPLG